MHTIYIQYSTYILCKAWFTIHVNRWRHVPQRAALNRTPVYSNVNRMRQCPHITCIVREPGFNLANSIVNKLFRECLIWSACVHYIQLVSLYCESVYTHSTSKLTCKCWVQCSHHWHRPGSSQLEWVRVCVCVCVHFTTNHFQNEILT